MRSQPATPPARPYGLASQTPLHAALYVGWLFLAWTLYVRFVYPVFPASPSLPEVLLQEAIRGLIFLLPLVLLLRHRSFLASLRLDTLTTRMVGIGLAAGLAWASVSIGLAVFVQHREIGGLPPITFWVTGFTIATVIEELTFRAYFTQVFSRYGTGLAVVGSSLLFVGIHVPGWILLGIPTTASAWIAMSLSIFVLGCLLAVLFLKTESVWPGILLHAFNNLAAALVT